MKTKYQLYISRKKYYYYHLFTGWEMSVLAVNFTCLYIVAYLHLSNNFAYSLSFTTIVFFFIVSWTTFCFRWILICFLGRKWRNCFCENWYQCSVKKKQKLSKSKFQIDSEWFKHYLQICCSHFLPKFLDILKDFITKWKIIICSKEFFFPTWPHPIFQIILDAKYPKNENQV